MMWQVTSAAKWIYGYRAWCCNAGQATTPVKCALWNPLSSTGGDGALIPNSAATSGTLVPGTWNTVLLPAPIPIALGTPYLAAIAYDGNFPFTSAGRWSPTRIARWARRSTPPPTRCPRAASRPRSPILC